MNYFSYVAHRQCNIHTKSDELTCNDGSVYTIYCGVIIYCEVMIGNDEPKKVCYTIHNCQAQMT